MCTTNGPRVLVKGLGCISGTLPAALYKIRSTHLDLPTGRNTSFSPLIYPGAFSLCRPLALHFSLAHPPVPGHPNSHLTRSCVDALCRLLDAAQLLRQPPAAAFSSVTQEERVRFTHGRGHVVQQQLQQQQQQPLSPPACVDLGLRSTTSWIENPEKAADLPYAVLVRNLFGREGTLW